MKIRTVLMIGVIAALFFCGLIFAYGANDGAKRNIKIGVLAHRGAEITLKMWGPTADYLAANIPRYSFSIVPLDFREIGPAVGRRDVDFVLANSSIYVELEALYNVSRIATLRNNGWQGGYTVFGGVIFCRADRSDINSLEDLKSKSFLAVDETSLGGWRVAWRELKKNGLDPYQDFASLRFADTHDAVVYAVRDHKADAGTVRTDILERMAAEKTIELGAFRILNRQEEKGFPFLLSTRLYPEWPLAVVRHTNDALAEQVVSALLKMPRNSLAAKAGKIAGWTIPLDYHPVHDLMKELRLAPYQNYGKVTLSEVIGQYWPWVVLASAALLTMILLTVRVTRLNKRLVLSSQRVEEARNGLEGEVQARTADLKTANEELRHEIDERKKTERVLSESEIKFRAVFEKSIDAIGISKTGIHVFVNPAYLTLFGYASNDDLAGKPVLDLIAPGERPAIIERIQRRARGETIHSAYETRGLRKNGDEFVMEVNASIYELSGSLYTLVILRDITERKRTEETLQKLSRAVEQSPTTIVITNTDGVIEYVNPKFTRITGYSADEAIGNNPRILQSGKTPREVYGRLWATIRAGNEWHGEFCNQKKNGEMYWESATIAPIMNDDGAITHYVAIKEDITGLKQAEELARQYSHDLEQLLSVSRETTITTDLKGLYRTFVRVSKEILNFDFSTLTLLSEDKKTLTMRDSLGFPESMIGRFSVVEGQGLATLPVKSKKPEIVSDFISEIRFEIPHIVHEKGIRSALAVPMMMKDDIIGVLIGHTVARREFSQKEIDLYQHIANQAAVAIRNAMNTDILRKSEKYLRDITASLGEGVYVLNENGETTFMNPEAEALLGWTEKELIHKNIHDIVHNRKVDGTPLLFEDCDMRNVIQTGNKFHSTEELFIKKDGTSFPVSVHSMPLMEDGKIVASVTAFRDISVRKQWEREREKMIADLQKALSEIKTLHGILPICSFCKKIRDDKGAWQHLETYISVHTDADFSHGLCKECAKKHYPQYFKEDAGGSGK